MRVLFVIACALSSFFTFASPAGYSYYKKLSTQESQISVNTNSLVGFPVLVRITDADLKSASNGGKVQSARGYDIIFTSADGNTLIPFQMEKYDSLSGEFIAWVKLQSLSATVNTDFYMYFGNPAVAVNLGSKSTWDANYKAVYHLNADIMDWTINASNLINTGTTNISPGIAADGQQIAPGKYLSRAATSNLQYRPIGISNRFTC